MEKVKNFQRNYLESEKFFSKFSYFLELKGKNFQNLKVRQPKSEHFQGNLRKVSENKNKTNFLINLLFQIFSCYFIIIIVFKSENPSTPT